MANDICATCGHEEPPKGSIKKRGKRKDQTINWISCDGCNKWLHTSCIRANDVLLRELSKYWYFCPNCTILGTLVPKQVFSTSASDCGSSTDLEKITNTITELSEKVEKLRAELEVSRLTCKKQTDKLRNQLTTADQRHDRDSAQRELVSKIEQKLEVIESGTRLANSCLRSVNGHRIAINKIGTKFLEFRRS